MALFFFNKLSLFFFIFFRLHEMYLAQSFDNTGLVDGVNLKKNLLYLKTTAMTYYHTCIEVLLITEADTESSVI